MQKASFRGHPDAHSWPIDADRVLFPRSTDASRKTLSREKRERAPGAAHNRRGWLQKTDADIEQVAP